MSHAREHRLKFCQFCPWCGTKTLRRDFFNPASKQPDSGTPSWICDNCCTGFQVRQSPRAQFVQRMYAIERAQRPPDTKGTGGAPPLSEKPLDELQRIEALLASKKPHTKSSREHVRASLNAIRDEIARRVKAA